MHTVFAKALLVVALSSPSCNGVLLKAGSLNENKLTSDHSTPPAKVIWVHAYARSGSSSVLSMISLNATSIVEEGGVPRGAFTLFEPCHPEDLLEPALKNMGCTGLLSAIGRCDFSGVRQLHGWSDVHSKKRGLTSYDAASASAACRDADSVSFKTIAKYSDSQLISGANLNFLKQDQRVRMIDVIRDPRSIFSSWLTTWPFNDARLGGMQRNIDALYGICDNFAANLDVQHPRIKRVLFEQLVKYPRAVLRETYDFLGLHVGDAQHKWISDTFNASACPGVDQWIAPYSDCHTNSAQSLERWKTTLSKEEKMAFAAHPQCRQVAIAYGYPISV